MDWYKYDQPVRKIPVQVMKNGNSRLHSNIQMDVDEKIAPEPTSRFRDEIATPTSDETDWKALALRLQADMDNFRRRQTRRADDAVARDRERLLNLILPIADNLTRALDSDHQEGESLRQGVELIYRELMRLLEAEEVIPIEAVGHPFDPNFHEALSTMPVEVESGIVVEEIETGYKLGDKLLRPARVIVAA